MANPIQFGTSPRSSPPRAAPPGSGRARCCISAATLSPSARARNHPGVVRSIKIVVAHQWAVQGGQRRQGRPEGMGKGTTAGSVGSEPEFLTTVQACGVHRENWEGKGGSVKRERGGFGWCRKERRG